MTHSTHAELPMLHLDVMRHETAAMVGPTAGAQAGEAGGAAGRGAEGGVQGEG